MQLLAVELLDFRNIPRALVEPHPRFNVFAGDNGQGKTNLLEAIYLVGTLRSFRASRLDELVRFGAASARAAARISRRGLERRYDVEVGAAEAGRAAKKLARVDGKPVRAAADYFGGFNVVLFCPDDLRLPRGAPAARRRFLDRAVWNVEPGFLKEAQTYERVLKSRNALLRNGTATPALLDVYDQQLATAGAAIALRRDRYTRAIAPRVAAAFDRITRSNLPATIRYQSLLSSLSALASDTPFPEATVPLATELHAALLRARPRDLAAGFTTTGPHTDDLDLALDHHPARLFASQGQLRAFVLALKVAEIQHLHETSGDAPILLLDDVSSELDPSRNAFLFSFLAEASGQVFITTTDARHVTLPSEPENSQNGRRDFRVFAGAIEAL